MKKREVVKLFIILLILSLVIVSAENDTSIDNGYQCLKDKVKDKCSSLSSEELAFTVLATGDCKSELEDKMAEENCWPSSGCRLKETALSIMALSKSGVSTDDSENWLLEQKQTSKDLIWYLEIDANEETICKLSYEGAEKQITVKADRKISGSPGTCLTIAEGGYWLKVEESCYSKNITVSCDKGFITALLYRKKTGGTTTYVSSKTNSASSEGRTEERVDVSCFKEGSSCNYEGSLWAVMALAEQDKDISEFLPYLIAMEDENEKYFPSAFLYLITGYDEYFSEIVNEYKESFWKIIDSPYHQFYDTSLGILALQKTSAPQVAETKTYLLGVQGKDGCWNEGNIRDTAFILFSTWPKAYSTPGPDVTYCEDYGYNCTSSFDCSAANKLSNFVCRQGISKVCCKETPIEETCAQKRGTICEGDDVCSGSIIPASDSYDCCNTDCVKPEPVKSECELENDTYVCRTSCADDEVSKTYNCDNDKICCAPKPLTPPSYWWIWLLVILIILVILGIIFRNRLRVSIFNIRDRFKKKGGPAGPATGAGLARPRPGFPPARPGGMIMRPRPRMIIPTQQQAPPPRQMPRQMRPMPTRKPASKTDEELDATLKKLKAMSNKK